MRILSSILSKTNQRYGYYPNRYQYQQQELADASRVEHILGQLDGITPLGRTITPIKVHGLNFNCTTTEVSKQLGKPLAKLVNPELEKHSIMLYQTRFFNKKVKLVFHFLDSLLFMAEYQFYQLNTTEQDDLSNMLISKFGCLLPFASEPQKITDAQGNALAIQQDVYTHFYYVGHNSREACEYFQANSMEARLAIERKEQEQYWKQII
ncbi:hypothetical protein KJS94_01535 [Flavihumibacter rivuli]|uniref:hypothetical protein n=1 Tax=Flavihumibacter rivuli TaxID=2838156 RepID=UPI001BDE9653|nr:hypothetical protein [Flavihumibacter rivuli]ULQ56878.1 hypothetical protein KJS94_01535 [Flavihumibacter rivuli]